MNLQKISDGINTYLLYQINLDSDIIDEISEQMINNNQKKMNSIIPVSFSRMNGRCDSMKFNITGKISLRQFVSYSITQEDFKKLMLKIISSFNQLDDYMIELSQIYLDMDYIFIDEISYNISFICIALQDRLMSNNQKSFFTELMSYLSVETRKSEKNYFNVISNIVQSSSFSIKNLYIALVEENRDDDKIESFGFLKDENIISEENVKTISSYVPPVPEKNIITDAANKEVSRNPGKSSIFDKLKKVIKGEGQNNEANQPKNKSVDLMDLNDIPYSNQNINDNMISQETNNFNLSYETALLQRNSHDDSRCRCFLKNKSEKFEINVSDFKIGRKGGKTNVTINLFLNSSRISAYHCQIICDFLQKEFWLVDHSSNWTLINNKLCEKNFRTSLNNGDIINFSGEEFIFICE